MNVRILIISVDWGMCQNSVGGYTCICDEGAKPRDSDEPPICIGMFCNLVMATNKTAFYRHY